MPNCYQLLLHPARPAGEASLWLSGQRLLTVMLQLNELEEGAWGSFRSFPGGGVAWRCELSWCLLVNAGVKKKKRIHSLCPKRRKNMQQGSTMIFFPAKTSHP